VSDIYDLSLPTPGMAALFRKADEIGAKYRRCWYCQQGDHGDCLGTDEGCRCIDCFPDMDRSS